MTGDWPARKLDFDANNATGVSDMPIHLEDEQDAELLFHLFVDMGNSRERALQQMRDLAASCARFDKQGSTAAILSAIERIEKTTRSEPPSRIVVGKGLRGIGRAPSAPKPPR